MTLQRGSEAVFGASMRKIRSTLRLSGARRHAIAPPQNEQKSCPDAMSAQIGPDKQRGEPAEFQAK